MRPDLEGLLDGDTVEAFLQEKDLTLKTTVTKGHEAAKQQRAEITNSSTEAISALRHVRPAENTPTQLRSCPGYGSGYHQGGRKGCPAYIVNLACHQCKRVGHLARVCRTKPAQTGPPDKTPQLQPPTKLIQALTATMNEPPQINHAKLGDTSGRAPMIDVHISSLNGAAEDETLPDSGADISADERAILSQLGEHEHNLLPSQVFPQAVNGIRMYQVGRLPITLQLGPLTHSEDLLIYPEVTGAWKAAKGLGILPSSYPHPSNFAEVNANTTTNLTPTMSEELIKEFPTVFNGQIKTMEVEKFHIMLTGDATPFASTHHSPSHSHTERNTKLG